LSPDGKLLAFAEFSPVTRLDIWLLSLGPERKTRPLIQTPFRDYQPSFSPDGRWLAYVSDESGRDEVYVQPFPALGAKWSLSTDGGDSPVWARHGRELFYENGGKLMAVSIRTDPTFVAAEPRLLFERSYELYAYDVSPDGRFIMIEPAEPDTAITQITLVQNWFGELKQRAALNSPAR
jgi:dipeptidyl aminopeptidase/acylaminoacyl peptidase